MYPLAFKISGKKLLFYGAGPVTLRKVRSLLTKDPEITVIAPRMLPEIFELAEEGRIVFEKLEYVSGEIKEIMPDFCFVCTDVREVNSAIVQECKSLRIPVNVADSPEESDFHMPATFCENGITVSVSTDGKDPALAKEIKEKLRACFDNSETPPKVNPYNFRF